MFELIAALAIFTLPWYMLVLLAIWALFGVGYATDHHNDKDLLGFSLTVFVIGLAVFGFLGPFVEGPRQLLQMLKPSFTWGNGLAYLCVGLGYSMLSWFLLCRKIGPDVLHAGNYHHALGRKGTGLVNKDEPAYELVVKTDGATRMFVAWTLFWPVHGLGLLLTDIVPLIRDLLVTMFRSPVSWVLNSLMKMATPTLKRPLPRDVNIIE